MKKRTIAIDLARTIRQLRGELVRLQEAIECAERIAAAGTHVRSNRSPQSRTAHAIKGQHIAKRVP